MHSLGLTWKRWRAIDGAKDPIARERVHRACDTFLCSKGTVGCYLSHVTLWEHLLRTQDADQEWFIVLEDDARLDDGFVGHIRAVLRDIKAWDLSKGPKPQIVHLAAGSGMRTSQVTENLWRGQPFFYTTLAYMVSREGLRCLLQSMPRKAVYHVDFMISLQILLGRIAYYCTSAHVHNADGMESTVSQGTVPRAPVVALNALVKTGLLNSHLHIIWNTALFHIGPFQFNITLLLYMLVLLFRPDWWPYILALELLLVTL